MFVGHGRISLSAEFLGGFHWWGLQGSDPVRPGPFLVERVPVNSECGFGGRRGASFSWGLYFVVYVGLNAGRGVASFDVVLDHVAGPMRST